MKNFCTELETYFDSLNEIMDMIKVLSERIEEIDQKLQLPQTSSYADATRSNPDAPSLINKRLEKVEFSLEKVEYQSSEYERQNRLHQVTITHPSLDVNSQNLFSTATYFMENILMMERRQIDANMYVQTTKRAQTILITFSDQRFKGFLFKARKNLPQQQFPIYINDFLTNFNYKILKMAKEERRRSYDNLNPIYETVYSYNGRIFIKKRRSDPTSDAIHIKSCEHLREIIRAGTPPTPRGSS